MARGSGGTQPAPLDAVAWLEALFSDLSVRSPHGIGWWVDRADLPLELRVSLADGPVTDLVLRDDGPAARIAVAEQVQLHVDGDWGVALPPCPDHGTGLRAARAGSDVRWRCPHGDVDCDIEDYDELLWPPRPIDDDQAGWLLGQRLRRRGIRRMSAWSVTDGVVRGTVNEGSDATALRAAAAPLTVELGWISPVGWDRRDGPDGETLTITHAGRQMARLTGPLRRAPAGGLHVGDVAVRLSFEHRVGPPGGPLILDAAGTAFAGEGDEVVCGGGFAPRGPIRGAHGVFVVGRLTRVPRDHRRELGGG